MAQQEPVRRYDTLSFDEALNVSDVMRERRTLRRISQVLAVLTVLLIGGGLLLGAYPLALQWKSSRELASQSEQVSEKVAALADWIELNLPEVLAVRDERAA